MTKRPVRKKFKKRQRASHDLEKSVRELNAALLVHQTKYDTKLIDAKINELYEMLDKASQSYTSLQNQATNIQKGMEDQLYTEEDVELVCDTFGLALEDVDPILYKGKHGDMEYLAEQVALLDVIGLDE